MSASAISEAAQQTPLSPVAEASSRDSACAESHRTGRAASRRSAL